MEIRTLTKIALIIFLYYIIYAVFYGILHPIPSLGDSWDYHIPISQSILNGNFINLSHVKLGQWYYPGSSEAINAFLILLHIPLTLSNIFAVMVLFFSCWKLGSVFKLDYYYSLLFAITFCSLNSVVRWLNAVSIDMWVAVFFCLAIILLEEPKKSWFYFLKLGFVFGMLVGSKYTACLFAFIVLCVYVKKLLPHLNLIRFFIFLLPFSIFGLFWYVRNIILIHNPFYPVSIFGFPGENIFKQTIFSVTIAHPMQMFNALFGEYKLWFLSLLLPLSFFISIFLHRRKKLQSITPELDLVGRLLVIGLLNALCFLQFPTSNQTWIMVSSFRYSYPIFIPLMLASFMLVKMYKKEHILGYFAIGNMLIVISFAYLPKLILLYLPLAFMCFYFLQRYEPKRKLRSL